MRLPYAGAIQRSFGRHDVSDARAHLGPAASAAARALSAHAFATGNEIVFGGAPDLRTAAHEAAHVVQQRHGAAPRNGIGDRHDSYERHADLVADRVASGRTAEDLLDAAAGVRGKAEGAVQLERIAVPLSLRARFGLPAVIDTAVTTKEQLLAYYETLSNASENPSAYTTHVEAFQDRVGQVTIALLDAIETGDYATIPPPTPSVTPPTPSLTSPTPSVMPPTPSFTPPTPSLMPPTPSVTPPTPSLMPPMSSLMPPMPSVTPPTPFSFTPSPFSFPPPSSGAPMTTTFNSPPPTPHATPFSLMPPPKPSPKPSPFTIPTSSAIVSTPVSASTQQAPTSGSVKNPHEGTAKFLRGDFGSSVHDQMHFKPTDTKNYHGVWTVNAKKAKDYVSAAINAIYYGSGELVASKAGTKPGSYRYLVNVGATVGYLSGSRVAYNQAAKTPATTYVEVMLDKKGNTISAFPSGPDYFQ